MKFIVVASMLLTPLQGSIALLDKKRLTHGRARSWLGRSSRRRHLAENCDWGGLLANECTLQEFCAQQYGEEDEEEGYTLTCGGDPAGDWYVQLRYVEFCFANATDLDGFKYMDGMTLEEGVFCSLESGFYNFTGDVIKIEDVSEDIVRPDFAKGLIREISTFEPCKVEFPLESDFEFNNVTYCYGPCIKYEMDGVSCAEECIECAGSDLQVSDCSAISPELKQSCEDEEGDAFYAAQLEYFVKKNNMTEASTGSPTFAPTGSPTANNMTKAPSSSPAVASTGSPTSSPAVASTGSPTASPATPSSTVYFAPTILSALFTFTFVAMLV